MGWDAVRNAGNKESEGLDYIKFKEGSTPIRIIGEPVVRWRHWIKSLNAGYFCPGPGCPVCEMNKRHKDNTGQTLHATSRRYSVQVIDREDNKIKIMDGSQALFDNLLMMMDEVGDLETFDVKINRKGTGLDTTWGVIPQPISELSDDDLELIDGFAVDLDEYLNIPTREQWLQLLEGEEPADVFKPNNYEEEEDDEEVEVDFTTDDER